MNTAVIRSDWVGRTVDGRFPLLECLGDSGTSVVFRTELFDPPAKTAAIRLIPVDGGNPQPQSLMKDWARAAGLSHPHLMKIFHSGHDEVDGVGLHYVVTEYAEENLAQIIPERPLTPDEVREMVPPVLDALSYLHGRGLVFGHIKPSNIMVVDNRLKLPVDSMAGVAGRKPQLDPCIYDAPETANGPGSPASDVWSLGVTLVEALTQSPPLWERPTSRDPLVPASLPQPFGGIARLCLRIDPGDRATLPAIRTRLDGADAASVPASERDTGPIPAAKLTIVSVPASESVSSAKPEPKTAPRATVEEPRRSAGSNRLIGLGVAGIVVLAVIVFVIARGHRSPAPPVATAPAPQAAVPEPPVARAPASSGSRVAGEVTERVMPEVSSGARGTIHGKILVKVQVKVDATGVVSGASIRSTGSRYFGAKALEAARKWRFRPPQANSRAVPSEWNLEFIFRSNGTNVNPVQVTP